MEFKRIVIDGHNDTMMKVIDEETWLPQVDIGGETDFHIDIGKLSQKISNPIFSAFTQGYYKDTAKSLARTLAILNGLFYTEDLNRSRFKVVKSIREIETSYREGKIGALASIEGAYGINEDNYYLLLDQFKDLGIKLIGFNWNYSNLLGEGVGETYKEGGSRSSGGLTDLGIRSLSRMEELGIGIDVSHMNEKTFWGVVDKSKNPIIASHSNAYRLANHRRNLKDDQLKAIGKSGGLVGAVLCPSFIKEGGDVLVKDYLDHIDYMVDLIGIDHVGLGSDFDGAPLPKDMKDASDINKIFIGLEERGYKEEEIDKIAGGNFLRVLGEIEDNKSKSDLDRLDLDSGEFIRFGEGNLLEGRFNSKTCVQIIIDGILYKELRDIEEVSLNLEYPNKESFHIVTTKVRRLGLELGETRIISI